MSALVIQNVEAAAVALLGTLGSEPAATKVPNPRPAAFYRVQRTGGLELNLAQERPLLLVEAYANTPTEAWRLAKAAWDLFHGHETLVGAGVALEGRELTSPVNYPDPTTTQARYQFTVSTIVNLVKEPTP